MYAFHITESKKTSIGNSGLEKVIRPRLKTRAEKGAVFVRETQSGFSGTNFQNARLLMEASLGSTPMVCRIFWCEKGRNYDTSRLLHQGVLE